HRHRVRAGGPSDLSLSHGAGESADRTRPPGRVAGKTPAAPRQGLRELPHPPRAKEPGRRHALRRRAANARDRARDDARAEDHPARRAHGRADAAHGVADPRHHRRPAPGRRGDPARGAERAAHARRLESDLHHGKGRGAPSRAGGRPACRPHRHPPVPGSVSPMIPIDQLSVQIVNGIVNGMILALVASGLTLIFGIMDVVNFAHGDLFMLGAYIGTTVYIGTGNFWAALVGSAVAMAVLGALLQVTALRPLIGRDPLTTILATFGISLVVQKYALWQWGPSVRRISEPVPGDFTLFHLQYPWYRIATAVLAGLILGGLWLFLKYGKYGIWIRATTQDRVMAQAMGIPVPLVYTAVFAIGSAMAAASDVLFGPFAGVTQTMGFDFTLRAFIVVVVGGMGNLGGSILASL